MKEKKPDNFKEYLRFGILLIVCLFSFFVNNQVIPADLMEARNLATAQEMVKYGTYLLPTLNGEPRIEKPPLPTWIAAGIEHLTPGNLVVQRYAAGVSATLMVLFLYLLTARLTRKRSVGLITALICATSVNVMLMGRTASWDIYTHSFMLGAIYFLAMALEERGAQWNNFLLAGVFAGLSFLSKGPVSMYALLIPFLISFILIKRPHISEKKWAIAGMICLCIVVSFWWYGYTYLFQKDFTVGVMQKESAAWLSYNVRPWYYYWQFPAEAGVWALYWVAAIVYFFLNKKTVLQKGNRLAFIWFTASLILISIIPEKKMRYLLPLLIPGSMLTGIYLFQMITAAKTKGEKLVFLILSMVVTLVLFALPFALYFLFFREKQISVFVFVAATVSAWGLCIFMITSLFGKKGINPTRVFVGILLTVVMIAGIYLRPLGNLLINDERQSIRVLNENKDITDLIYYCNAKEELRMELVYEANNRIIKLDPEDDAAIENALPFVFISSESIEKLMTNKKVLVEFIGVYDHNWRKKTDKRHNPDLVKEVAIIRR